ncbi:uncharacterized protein [Branchiostoma lanceolatum]|uniref:uncharacterized protein n=1 Tax=Branchiostoma lanceolatum TaxID=7740 RepID=UPI0034517CFB
MVVVVVDAGAATAVSTMQSEAITEVLLLPENVIVYIAPNVFRHVPKLKKLNLARNRLTDFPWRHMQAQSSLIYLDLAGNSLTSLPDDALKFLPALEELSLKNNKLMSIPPGSFHDVPNLTTVNIDGNPWKCDCEFLRSYNTFPPAIARVQSFRTCSAVVERVSGCADGAKGFETEKNANDKNKEEGEVQFKTKRPKLPLRQKTINPSSPRPTQPVVPTVHSTPTADDKQTTTRNDYQKNPNIGKIPSRAPWDGGMNANPIARNPSRPQPATEKVSGPPATAEEKKTMTTTQNGYQKNPDIGNIPFSKLATGLLATSEEEMAKAVITTESTKRDSTRPFDANAIRMSPLPQDYSQHTERFLEKNHGILEQNFPTNQLSTSEWPKPDARPTDNNQDVGQEFSDKNHGTLERNVPTNQVTTSEWPKPDARPTDTEAIVGQESLEKNHGTLEQNVPTSQLTTSGWPKAGVRPTDTDMDSVPEPQPTPWQQQVRELSKPNDSLTGSPSYPPTSTVTSATLTLSTIFQSRPMKKHYVKMSKTATYDASQLQIIGVSVGLVVLVAVVSCVAVVLKVVRSRKPEARAATDEDDDDEIQPYSTRYFTANDKKSPSPPSRRSQANHYYLPADHHIVRHTYVDPDSPDVSRREGKAGGVTRKDGVQAYLMNKLKLRGPRPGEGYEDAVPVRANHSKNLPVTSKTGRRQMEGTGKPEEDYEDAVPVYAKPHRAKNLPVTPSPGRRQDDRTGELEEDYEDTVPVYAKPHRSKSLPVTLTTRQVEGTAEQDDDYEDAVPVYAKPDRSKSLPLTPRPGRRLAGELPDKMLVYTKPNTPSVDKAYSLPSPYTKLTRPKKPTDPPKKPGHLQPANLLVIDEEDHEYEEAWSHGHAAQRKEKQNDLGQKGGRRWEMEANQDGRQLNKPNIYEKPEVVIGNILLSRGV